MTDSMTRARERGAVILIALAFVLLVLALAAVVMILGDTTRRMADVATAGVTPAAAADGPFARAWSVAVSPPLIHEMAEAPGAAGEFVALNSGRIQRFDATGIRVSQFDAPSKASRLATDPTGAIPHLLVVSSASKWTGAIDHTVTTDYFFQALDSAGREVWKKRFDPKEVSSLEPSVAMLHSRPVVILSASGRILAFDAQGTQLWGVSLWHHPGTVTAAALDGGTALLAAAAPRKEIVRIDGDGEIRRTWGTGDGPSRLRAMTTGGHTYAVSLRQVFGRGGGHQALAFFDATGEIVREVVLPPNAQQLSYSPIASIDTDGRGDRKWAIGLGDGTILLFSPRGEELARHATGERLRTILAVRQRSGPDLLVAATHRGLTAWRPVTERIP